MPENLENFRLHPHNVLLVDHLSMQLFTSKNISSSGILLDEFFSFPWIEGVDFCRIICIIIFLIPLLTVVVPTPQKDGLFRCPRKQFDYLLLPLFGWLSTFIRVYSAPSNNFHMSIQRLLFLIYFQQSLLKLILVTDRCLTPFPNIETVLFRCNGKAYPFIPQNVVKLLLVI